jgi:N-ethylmaleimide reductase
MSDSDPAALFGHVATRLDGYGPAYLHIILPVAYASRSRCRVR